MKNTKIEWCDSTWNPVTGCYHICRYCYAIRIAERFGGKQKYANIYILDEPVKGEDGKTKAYPYSFSPTFYRYRLKQPKEWHEPKNIFVCSMADLFGAWVPDKWIEEIFEACEDAPQHNYLFLTKNPVRYIQLAEAGKLPDKSNMWYGATITTETQKYFYCNSMDRHTFVSIEPIMEDFNSPGDLLPEWVIVGAETGNRRDKVTPEKAWIDHLVNECEKQGIPLFMKDSLIPVVGKKNMRREFPAAMKMALGWGNEREVN